MEFSEYQKLAVVTKKKWPTKDGELADCALGIMGEGGEVCELIKKHLGGSKQMDNDKLKIEIGDVLWYIASLCDCMGFDMDELAKMNIDKLKNRHGGAWSGFGNRTDAK